MQPGSFGSQAAVDRTLQEIGFFFCYPRHVGFASVKPALPQSSQLKGLILAQNERWRRGLGMQVERQAPFGEWRSGKRGSKASERTPQSGIAVGNCG